MPHPSIRTWIASCPKFLMKLDHIVTSLSPSLLNIRKKTIKLARLLTRFAFGKVSCRQPTLNRALSHAKMICYGLMRPSLLSQCDDLLIASQSCLFSHLSNSCAFRGNLERLFDGRPSF